jgi:hypothetical protein
MISDNDALLITGDILAGFLKEHLPSEERWRDFVVPSFRPGQEISERPLDQLDLAGLIQIFIHNKSHLMSNRSFNTRIAFDCAQCVRHMRNTRAHLSYGNVISDDERLFDLNNLRRFVMLIENRATTPGLIEQLLAAIDTVIRDLSDRCLEFGGNVKQPEPTIPLVKSDPVPVIDRPSRVEQLVEQSRADLMDLLLSVEKQVGSIVVFKEKLGGDEAPENPESAGRNSQIAPNIERKLNDIERKIDLLISRETAIGQIQIEDGGEFEPNADPEFLSKLEAKGILRGLRATAEQKYPNSNGSRGLLRQSMIDFILEHRIDGREAFDRQVPEVMRRDTDVDQFELLPAVFRVVGRLR